MNMLSPHELATLMVVRSAPEQIDVTRVEVDTLLDGRLISVESAAGEQRRLTLTAAGRRLLEAAARLYGKRYDDALPAVAYPV